MSTGFALICIYCIICRLLICYLYTFYYLYNLYSNRFLMQIYVWDGLQIIRFFFFFLMYWFLWTSYFVIFPLDTVNIPEEVQLCPKQLIGMTPFSNVSREHDNIDNVSASTNLLWSKLNSVSWCPQLMLEGSQKPLWLMLVDGSFFSSVNPSCGQSEKNTVWSVQRCILDKHSARFTRLLQGPVGGYI